MRLISSLVLVAGMVVPSFAGDFDAVIKSASGTWPERRTVVVVCNKDASSMALMDLGSATGKQLSLFVVDVLSAKEVERAVGNVSRKNRGDIFVLLISDDPVVGEKTEAGRILVSRMTQRGIPVVGTTLASLKLGAVMAEGTETGDKMLTNPDAAKKVGVVLPNPVVAVATVAATATTATCDAKPIGSGSLN